MSKRENHWYVVKTIGKVLAEAYNPRRIWPIFLVGMLVAGVFTLIVLKSDLASARLGEWLKSPVFNVVLAGGVGAGILVVFLRVQHSFRKAYLGALASPEPAQLVEVIERSLQRARMMPDWDAYVAHGRVLAYAIYGRTGAAERALASVHWSERAPVIQAMGLNGEGIVELLCRQHPRRSLDSLRRARELAAVSGLLPGAARGTRFHDTSIFLAEVLTGVETAAASRSPVEKAATDLPPMQLIASFALALTAELAGDRERAEQLRSFLRGVAPHCAPLHLGASDFTG